MFQATTGTRQELASIAGTWVRALVSLTGRVTRTFATQVVLKARTVAPQLSRDELTLLVDGALGLDDGTAVSELLLAEHPVNGEAQSQAQLARSAAMLAVQVVACEYMLAAVSPNGSTAGNNDRPCFKVSSDCSKPFFFFFFF